MSGGPTGHGAPGSAIEANYVATVSHRENTIPRTAPDTFEVTSNRAAHLAP